LSTALQAELYSGQCVLEMNGILDSIWDKVQRDMQRYRVAFMGEEQ